MYDINESRRVTIQHNVLLLIEYLYWVTFSLLAVAAFLIVVFLTMNPGWAVLAFCIPALIAGLCHYPKNLIKDTIPLIVQMMREHDQPFSLDEKEMDENPLEPGYHPMQLVQ